MNTLALLAVCNMQLAYPQADSNHFYFQAGEGNRVRAERYVESLLKEHCPGKQVTIHNTQCKWIEPDDVSTRVCTTNTSAGRFFTLWDMMGNAHVVFTRWD